MDDELKLGLELLTAFGVGVLVGFYVIPRPSEVTGEGYDPLTVPDTCDEG